MSAVNQKIKEQTKEPKSELKRTKLYYAGIQQTKEVTERIKDSIKMNQGGGSTKVLKKLQK